MKVAIMQPYFFPYLGYFQLIKAVDIYVNLDHVNFMKRGYMTRNTLKNNTTINLIVNEGSQNNKCYEVMVNFENKYIDKFKKKIQFLYCKSPYYNEINSIVIEPFFIERHISVSKFNIELIKTICNYLDVKTKIIDSSVGFTDKKKGSRNKTNNKEVLRYNLHQFNRWRSSLQ